MNREDLHRIIVFIGRLLICILMIYTLFMVWNLTVLTVKIEITLFALIAIFHFLEGATK